MANSERNVADGRSEANEGRNIVENWVWRLVAQYLGLELGFAYISTKEAFVAQCPGMCT